MPSKGRGASRRLEAVAPGACRTRPYAQQAQKLSLKTCQSWNTKMHEGLLSKNPDAAQFRKSEWRRKYCVKARGVSRGLLDRYNDRGEHLGGIEPTARDRAVVSDRLGAFPSANLVDSQTGEVPSAFVAL